MRQNLEDSLVVYDSGEFFFKKWLISFIWVLELGDSSRDFFMSYPNKSEVKVLCDDQVIFEVSNVNL